ncbi:MAG: hypothetical protein IPJ06_14335 [Saprospiraceae bacterium]|nr:hypothetical protein [Saprospiraceae bacterium]
MAIHGDKFLLHREAIEETLESVRLLINYSKRVKSSMWNESEGCLGYPSAILLFSIVNAFGNLFFNSKISEIKIDTDKKTFAILNSHYFSNQNIDYNILDNLYETFRSRLTHNLALPFNYIMKPKSTTGKWYEISKNDNGEDVISTIYLLDLLELCVSAFNRLSDEHQEKFFNSKKISDLQYKDMRDNPTILDNTASGANCIDNQ